MKLKEILLYIGIIIGLILVDQVSKYFVFKNLELRSYECIPGFIRFDVLYNKGAMFGIFQGKTVLFFIVTIIGLGVFGYMLKYGNMKEHPFYTMGLLFMIGGTVGNFIDRFLSLFPSTGLQGVRDFITFDFFNFASFNFADMCMCCGIVMLAFDIIFGDIGKQWT